MSDGVFIFGVLLLTVGALVLTLEAFRYYASRSNLYSQERYDKAFRQIIKRELALEKKQRRQQRMFEDATQLDI